jgi:hypothetical protein
VVGFPELEEIRFFVDGNSYVLCTLTSDSISACFTFFLDFDEVAWKRVTAFKIGVLRILLRDDSG